eukprot:6176523-Pleurochrysis_carterae.AAC.2
MCQCRDATVDTAIRCVNLAEQDGTALNVACSSSLGSGGRTRQRISIWKVVFGLTLDDDIT